MHEYEKKNTTIENKIYILKDSLSMLRVNEFCHYFRHVFVK